MTKNKGYISKDSCKIKTKETFEKYIYLKIMNTFLQIQ